MADYPTSIWAGNTRGTNLSDAETHTTWHDEVMAEVIAMQSEMGTTPSGTASSVKTRLDAACQVSMSAAQSCASGSTVAMSFDTEDYDPLAWHAPGTPTLITPNIAGWYQVTVLFDWAVDTDYTRRLVEIQKNGAASTPLCRNDTSSTVNIHTDSLTSPLISMNGSSDTLRLTALQTNTSAGANTIRIVFTVRLVIAV